jgi:hypothetical protein
VGTLELVLVEKIAAVIWKQKRLAEANSASVQLATRPENYKVRDLIGKALGGENVSLDDLLPLNEDDYVQITWCNNITSEYEDLTAEDLAGEDMTVLSKKAPLIYKQFCDEAQEEEVSPAEYIKSLTKDLMGWVVELKHWCNQELKKYETREKTQPILQLVQRKETAHMGLELMNRYQTASDNELYRAMDALRKQQEWRQKNSIALEAEVEVA